MRWHYAVLSIFFAVCWTALSFYLALWGQASWGAVALWLALLVFWLLLAGMASVKPGEGGR